MEIKYESRLHEDIIKQINFLVATPVGTVACDRDFGMDMSFVDKPLPIAQTLFTAELVEKLNRYIPSVRLQKVTFENNHTGDQLTARLVIDID